jgi:hypothetical protein
MYRRLFSFATVAASVAAGLASPGVVSGYSLAIRVRSFRSDGLARSGKIALFARVAPQFVEFRLRRANVLLSAGTDGRQRAPAEVVIGIIRSR